MASIGPLRPLAASGLLSRLLMNLILVLETKLERNWTAGTAKNVFLNVLVSEALYRPLRLCIGLYRPSEPAGCS